MPLPVAQLDRTHESRLVGREQLNIDLEWEPIIRSIVEFKDAIDRSALLEEEMLTLAERELLAQNDFVPANSKNFDRSPEGFRKLIMGPFEFKKTDLKRTCLVVPDWSVLGYLRRPQYINRLHDAASIIKNDVDRLNDAFISCYGGIPLFFAGEGKNRASLHREAGLSYLASIVMHGYPAARSLSFQRVAGCKNLVALHAKRRFSKATALLPFPAISIPLLRAYGAAEIRRPWVGFLYPFRKIYRDRNDMQAWGFRSPKSMRERLLTPASQR